MPRWRGVLICAGLCEPVSRDWYGVALWLAGLAGGSGWFTGGLADVCGKKSGVRCIEGLPRLCDYVGGWSRAMIYFIFIVGGAELRSAE